MKEDLRNKIEHKYGSIALLKVYVNTLNRLLVDKGLITEEELISVFEEESAKYREE